MGAFDLATPGILAEAPSGILGFVVERVPVLHLISDAGPHPYFRTLIESGGLRREGLMVGCVGPAGHLQREMEELGVATFALGADSRRSYPGATAQLARLLRKRQIKVIQTHLVDGCLVGLTAARLARTPVAVMTAHHSHELPFQGRKLLLADRLCTGRLSDHIIAPSHQVADVLTRMAGVPENKIAVVHHGFDMTLLDPGSVDGRAVRRELALEGKLVIGAVGRSFRLKNYPALLRAFATGLIDVEDARLLIVGPGDQQELESLAQALGIADRVAFCGSRNDIPEVLAAIDVFVHPAIAESFGMVIVEAMAMARPVVATPVGIAPEVIVSGQTGVLCSSPDPAALSEGLRQMLDLRSQWAQIGAAARERVASFTAASTVRRYERLYADWIAGGRGAASANGRSLLGR